MSIEIEESLQKQVQMAVFSHLKSHIPHLFIYLPYNSQGVPCFEQSNLKDRLRSNPLFFEKLKVKLIVESVHALDFLTGFQL
jgi:hypothetical protein